MKNLLSDIKEILLMGPGPSCVPDAVYEALAVKTVGHLDPAFIGIMDAIKQQLQQLMQTSNQLTFPVSGTGSAGMETCFVNIIEPGDRVLVLINGVFGVRMREVATRLGAVVDALEFEWGTPVDVDSVRTQLKKARYKIVAVVHAETSTGVMNPVAEIGALLQHNIALYLVDAVTSLGGIPVRVDDWGIDMLYSGTQKCLSCPPGLSPVTFSKNAVEILLHQRKTKVPNWYLDLSLILNYWQGAQRVYHHTAPINMLYGLYQALWLVFEEGLEAVHRRHMDNHRLLVQGLEAMDLSLLPATECRLPMLNAVRVPDGVDEAAVRRVLLQEHRIEIGAGLGPLAGKIWRVGLMGHTARKDNVERFLAALKTVLKR